MKKSDIRDDADMLEYVLECTLATIEHYAMLSRPPKHEVDRQCSIADTINAWLLERPYVKGSRLWRLRRHANAMGYYSFLRDK